MINISNISNIYFIGIGGIGMSALARYFNEKGAIVSGYDKTPSELTEKLQSEGINIHFTDDVNLTDKQAQVVVYTPAVPAEHTELNYFRDNNYAVVKRSDILSAVTDSTYNICVAGTHGKTTISSMVAHILHTSGYGCTAFLGGISVNYDTNYRSTNSNVAVVEADEYDRSFLKLSPDVAIISAMDADHLDIYGTEEALQQAFIDFSAKVKSTGLLISKYGLSRTKDLKAAGQIHYSLQNDAADAYACNIRIKKGSYVFDVMTKDWMLDDVCLYMGGMHNVENAVAAIVTAHYLKIDSEKIKDAIASFKGVKRRFEFVVRHEDGAIYIDDYAHHPEELRSLITGAKSLYPKRKCLVIFQPHLFTRTRDLADAFAETLDLADETLLLPIYPARELPIEGVTAEMIASKMHNGAQVLSKQEVLNHLRSLSHEQLKNILIITAGAGDIDQLIEPIKQIIK
ncbi:UDP-N-acetylmuramate--L-alanine ligase [soil metagenome]